MLQITCVSHQCLLWGDAKAGEGRHLADADVEALSRVHQLAHSIKHITIADLFGDQENE